MRRELSRLCEEADALSVEAYGDYLAHAVAAWERSNVPIQGRGLMFGNRKRELRELCNEARARLAAAWDGPTSGDAARFIDRLERGGSAAWPTCATPSTRWCCRKRAASGEGYRASHPGRHLPDPLRHRRDSAKAPEFPPRGW